MKIINLLILTVILQLNVFSQDLVRGPYLQSLSPTSVKVMYRTSEPVMSDVLVSSSVGGDVIYSGTSDSAVTDHVVLIENLNPGSTYYYKIGREDDALTDWDNKYRFKTIPPNPDKTSFWVTGDFGSKSQKQIDVKNAFINHVNGEYPDVWLWLGDNAYDDGKDFEYQERVFTPPFGYDDILPFLPVYPIPGNHEYNSINAFAPPPDHAGPYYRIVEVPKRAEAGGVPSYTELYYSFDYGDVHFVAINSEVFAYTFFENSVMSDWLKRDLAANDKLFTVAYWHQPPYSKGSHDSDDFWEVFMKAMRKNYNPIMDEYGVDLVLCGHSHVYERTGLIRGHYGNSGSFKDENIIDNEEPFIKYLDGDQPNYGTMYAVVGNSGKTTSDAPGNHPAFIAYDYDQPGSLLVNVEGNTLNGKYIRGDGTIYDEFNIIKALQDSSVITNAIDAIIADFNIYPNPIKDELNIQFNVKKETPIAIHIYDEAGKTYYSETDINYSVGNHVKKLNLADYNIPSGNYIIKFGGGEDGQTWRFNKIVKVE